MTRGNRVVPVTGLPSAAPRWSSAADHPDRALTAHPADAEARGDDSPDQVEAPMQVPMTVQPLAGGSLRGW